MRHPQYQAWYTLPQTTFSKRSAVVIGAGLAGAAAAYALAKRDWQVTVIERHSSSAKEASGIAAGVVAPRSSAWHHSDGGFYLHAYRYTLDILEKLSVKFNRCGVIQLARNAKDEDRQIKLLGTIPQDNSFAYQVGAQEASLLSGVALQHGGIVYPQGGYLNPKNFCDVMLDSKNIDVVFSNEAIYLQRVDVNSDWHITNNKGEILMKTPVVIIANSGAASSFSQSHWLPLVKIRGQVSCSPAKALTKQLSVVLCHTGYLTPAENDIHIFGASFQRERLGTELSNADDLDNIRRINEFAPQIAAELANDVTGQHAALRAATTDRLPCIGPLPDVEHFAREGRYHPGLFVSTGFATRGIIAAPLAGEMLAAMVNREQLPLPQDIIDALNPARFLIRRLRRGLPLSP